MIGNSGPLLTETAYCHVLSINGQGWICNDKGQPRACECRVWSVLVVMAFGLFAAMSRIDRKRVVCLAETPAETLIEFSRG